VTLRISFDSDNLPFVVAPVAIHEVMLPACRLLIDTGSATTVFRADLLLEAGIAMDLSDVVVDMYGVGGRETVLERTVSSLTIDQYAVGPFTLQRGLLNYGFALDGIIGSDFLRALGLTIDYHRGELRKDP
jgi:hypothetical protein